VRKDVAVQLTKTKADRPAEPKERKINNTTATPRHDPSSHFPPKERDHDSNYSSAVLSAGAKPETEKKKVAEANKRE